MHKVTKKPETTSDTSKLTNKIWDKIMSSFQKEDYDESIKSATAYLRIDKENASVLQLRARCFHKKKKYTDAIVDYFQSLLIDPDRPDRILAKFGIHCCLMEINKQDKSCAIEMAQSLKKKDPSNYLWAYSLGLIYFRNMDYVNAEKQYTLAIELCRKDVILFEARAECWVEMGCFEKAIDDYSISLELCEGTSTFRTDIYFNRASAFLKIDEIEKAELDIRRIRKFDPSLESLSLWRPDAEKELYELEKEIKQRKKKF